MYPFKKYYFLFLILLITFFSVNQWSSIPIGNTTILWFFSFLIIFYVLNYKKKEFHPNNLKDYRVVTIYLLWLCIEIVRGIFVPDNYWEWKQLVNGSLALSLPLFVYIFSSEKKLQETLSYWLKYAIPVFFLFFIWSISRDAYHFYLGPVLLLACLFPIIPNKKWKIIIIICLLLMLFADWGARSQVIKAAISIIVGIGCTLHSYIGKRTIRLGYWLCYMLPIILLILGISGVFNIFEDLSKNEGRYVERKMVDGQLVEEDLSADTRTFIYEEVITSAIKHNYVLWGRTPARGNDSMSFGAFNAEELKTGRYERHSNEVCHPNIFTWLGLVGMILYSLIYFRSSYLAVYKSNNIYIKLLGVFIAFRWAFGWIEDFNRFDILNISLWMMIAMGFSEQFRRMNNIEFKQWVVGIFKK